MGKNTNDRHRSSRVPNPEFRIPMKITALAAHTPEAVRAALAVRGWEPQPAWFAATGIQPIVLLLEEISEDEREALVHWSTKSGVDVLTGEGWALMAGAA